MDDVFKKLFYSGIGYVSLTAKKFAETIEELKNSGKISEEEGQRIMDKFAAGSGKAKEEAESNLRSFIESVLTKMEIATRRDLRNLESRISRLEEGQEVTSPISGRSTGDTI